MYSKTYQVKGMTCEGCKASVEKSLLKIPEMESAVVNLEAEEVHIRAAHPIPLDVLSSQLESKYQISEKNIFSSSTDESNPITKASKLTQLKPLFLILGYILIASLLLNYQRSDFSGFMPDFMGLFFIVFSFFKLLDLKNFPDSFRMYDPLAKIVPFYAWIYPFIEVALGLMFLMRFELTAALILTIIILGITTIGVTRSLLGKQKIKCACLGTALNLPMTEATFIENAIMIAMAVWMLINSGIV